MSDQPVDESVVFGDVRERNRDNHAVSPETNGHWAMVAVSRLEGARPVTKVFVDLDTMLDLHDHAAEDTSVELGGILLGCRGTSSDGTPFVYITDSIRARHYRATRGSFTFTHETWADLNSQRSVLPNTTEIVGWYHTHPGWGVFLSDMDVFICDHFFAKADDVALVIDPTTNDTGLFVRRNTSLSKAPSRLPVFYLTAHRKRISELTLWAQFFAGGQSMNPSSSLFSQRTNAPIVITQPTNSSGDTRLILTWLMVAVIVGQFAILATLLTRPFAATTPVVAAERTDQLVAREQIVDSLLKTIATSGPDQVVQDHRRTTQENAELRASQLGLMAQINQLDRQQKQATSQEQRAQLELATAREELAVTKSKLAQLQPPADGTLASFWSRANFLPAGIGLGAGLLLGTAAALTWLKSKSPNLN
jgi:proteasome lid subunit RPN8/RPN11